MENEIFRNLEFIKSEGFSFSIAKRWKRFNPRLKTWEDTKFPEEAMDSARQLKKMLDEEWDKWSDSRNSVTFQRINKVRPNLVALTTAKDAYGLIMLLSVIKMKFDELYVCFWPKKKERIAKRRLKALNLLTKMYDDSLVSLKAEIVMRKMKEKNLSQSEYVEKMITASKDCRKWESLILNELEKEETNVKTDEKK